MGGIDTRLLDNRLFDISMVRKIFVKQLRCTYSIWIAFPPPVVEPIETRGGFREVKMGGVVIRQKTFRWFDKLVGLEESTLSLSR